MLNNDGDVISLKDNSDYEQDIFAYTEVQVFHDTWIMHKNTIMTLKYEGRGSVFLES